VNITIIDDIHRSQIELPVAMMLSPGASMPPGGLMKQLFGAVVWNWNRNMPKISVLLRGTAQLLMC
jgi:hypothetical protein